MSVSTIILLSVCSTLNTFSNIYYPTFSLFYIKHVFKCIIDPRESFDENKNYKCLPFLILGG